MGGTPTGNWRVSQPAGVKILYKGIFMLILIVISNCHQRDSADGRQLDLCLYCDLTPIHACVYMIRHFILYMISYEYKP